MPIGILVLIDKLIRPLEDETVGTCAAFLLGFILGISSAFSSDAIGVITYVQGKAKINNIDATEGQRVHAFDTVNTESEALVQVMLIDNNIIHVGPSSKVMIKEYSFDEYTDTRWSSYDVSYGQLRSSVNQKYYKPTQGFRVTTPVTVLGVRGTDFLVEYSEKNKVAEINVFKGDVEQGSKGPDKTITKGINIPVGKFMQVNSDGRAFNAPKMQDEKKLAELKAQTEHAVDRNNKFFTQLMSERLNKTKQLKKMEDYYKEQQKKARERTEEIQRRVKH